MIDMTVTQSPFADLRENARQRLLDALTAKSPPGWTAGTEEQEEVSARIQKVKKWLLAGSMKLAEPKTAFTAEDIMERLGDDDWRTLGVVYAALHELCCEGSVAVLEPGSPTVYCFR